MRSQPAFIKELRWTNTIGTHEGERVDSKHRQDQMSVSQDGLVVDCPRNPRSPMPVNTASMRAHMRVWSPLLHRTGFTIHYHPVPGPLINPLNTSFSCIKAARGRNGYTSFLHPPGVRGFPVNKQWSLPPSAKCPDQQTRSNTPHRC